jgi:cholesterol oxidase
MTSAGGTAPEHFRAVVVGSGFGGSVMTHRLAAAQQPVCLLERGRAYPPGSFPRSPRAVADNVWARDRGRHGLYDFWSFDGFEALVSSGLGGGSLIYANVLLEMPPAWFVTRGPDGTPERWPVDYDDLRTYYATVKRELGASEYPYGPTTTKTQAFERAARAAGLEPEPVELAVSFAAANERPRPGAPLGRSTLHDVERSTCRRCGECDLGCNYGSKNTTDLTYLAWAKEQGADIRTGAEALWIRPRTGGGFEVEYLEHPEHLDGVPSLEDDLPRATVTCDRLVLSAGSLATTHLLLRNRHWLPGLSARLGTRFSGNGDFLAFASGVRELVDSSAGPVITRTARVADEVEGGDGPGFYLQDGGYPEFFNWVVQGQPTFPRVARIARFAARQVVGHLRHDPHSEVSAEVGSLLGRQETAYALPLLGMGRDVPDGVMSLRDGYLAIDWTTRTSRRYFERVHDAMADMSHALGGRLTDHLLTRMGRVITVHPVGGCPMGTTRDDGVVDSYGRAFGYPDLVIADGSVLPGPAGANPSLTIAALSARFADELCASLARPRP